MKYSKDDYLNFDLFQGEEAEITCRNFKMVKAKKEHACFFGLGSYGDGHTIKAGENYRYETGLVDGSFWGKYRCCIKCLDKHISEMEGN